jgi:HK97 family phage portal protein
VNIFGLSITRAPRAVQKAPNNLAGVDSRGGWWPIIRESYAGAWQQNVEITVTNVMTYSAVYACVTLIASDIGKLRLKLMQQDANGIWTETTSPAFSPVLRKPNRFQTRIKFLEQWMASKLIHGNTYVLKERDDRNVVRALYVLDAQRCRPLVAENGDVFYELKRDTLSGLENDDNVLVPASEIIHDVMVPLYHPLVGISPISACGLAAVQGLRIQNNSALFFGNGSTPGGVLTAPETIADETADRLKAYWDENFSGANVGKVAVLGDGLKYEQMTMSAIDSQLIDQLKWTAENVCTAFHVPPYMVGIGPPPTYNNIEALNQQYYSQCLQNPIESIEILLDEGLGMVEASTERLYGVELELNDLLRMDTATRVSAAEKSMKAGMTVDEVRRTYYDLGPVTGGDTVYMQQQNFSLEALSKRDAGDDPFGTKAAAAPPATGADPAPEPDDDELDDADEETKALTLAFMIRKECDRLAEHP